MEGRSPEFGSIPEEEIIDKGFSEKKIARKREGRGFDNSQVQKTAPARKQVQRNPLVGKQRNPLTRFRQKIKRAMIRRDSLLTPSKEPKDLVK